MPQSPKPAASPQRGRWEHWEQVSFFQWVEVVRDLSMDPTTKFVGLMLATYATYSDGHDAHPGVEGLMIATGYGSRTTITKALERLRQMGLIERRFTARKGGRSQLADMYYLTLHNQVRREAGHKPCQCAAKAA